jgi:hypothetical protein
MQRLHAAASNNCDQAVRRSRANDVKKTRLTECISTYASHQTGFVSGRSRRILGHDRRTVKRKQPAARRRELCDDAPMLPNPAERHSLIQATVGLLSREQKEA